ncbi:MAG: hypothetical protein IPL78_10940 [Chloroflexi bacterium]|nr:hypothetical protein [Chloroflexota bacterium]
MSVKDVDMVNLQKAMNWFNNSFGAVITELRSVIPEEVHEFTEYREETSRTIAKFQWISERAIKIELLINRIRANESIEEKEVIEADKALREIVTESLQNR